jgi:hypothetical protein
MSTEWLPSKPIPFKKVKGLKSRRVWEVTVPPDEHGFHGTTKNNACLTDGTNYLWAFDNNGSTWFTRYGSNDDSDILEALSEIFDVVWVSEHDPGFGRLANKYSHIKLKLARNGVRIQHHNPRK